MIIISKVDNKTHSSKYWQLDIISGHVLHCKYILAISVNRDKILATLVGMECSHEPPPSFFLTILEENW